MLVKKIKIFIKRNKIIFAFFIISIIVVAAYYLTMDLPELFNGAERWFNLLSQLSIGYIINFIFYVTQVYIPNNKRDSMARKNVSIRVKQIVGNMRSSLSSLAEIYLDGHTGADYTNEELAALSQLKLSDNVKVVKANMTTKDNFVYFTVREWLGECIRKTENEIDKLYRYYPTYISEELMQGLEDVLNSTYHTAMKTILVVPGVISLKRLLNHHFLRNWSSKMIKKSLEAYFLPKIQNCTFLKTLCEKATFMPLRAG